MYRCSSCGTSFVWPVPSDEALGRFYHDYHLAATQGGWYDDVEDRMQADFPAKIERIRAFSPARNPGRILDVGCGKGYFVKACVDAGLDAQGCDLSTSGVEFARESLKVRATCGLLRDIKTRLVADAGAFDTATLWATIEHLPDPIGTLKDIFDILKPGGRLLLDTGIGDDWLDRLLPGRVQWFDPPQHLFVFSAPGLRVALEKAGFSVVSMDTCFDRTPLRRVLRRVRNGTIAAVLRAGAELGRMRSGAFGFTRYPIGNLQSFVAQRPA
jgi:SAM-dependent methyltransferase